MRKIWLIAKTILIESIRRRDIYVIAFVAAVIILIVGVFRFFGIEGLHKFFREVSLTVMNWATTIIVVLLAARQLPREFESRTIYPLLAKPVTRLHFLLGKFTGVLLAAGIAYAIFMAAFAVGQAQTGVPLVWPTFLQMIYLHFLALAILCALTLMLSTLMTHSATVTVAFLFFIFSETLTSFLRIYYYYRTTGPLTKHFLYWINYAVPQLALLDLTDKVVHDWPPVGAWVLGFWTVDAAMFVVVFFAISFLKFHRREI